MSLYIGIIEENGHNRMYVSSVSRELTQEDAMDIFEDNSFYVDFTHRGHRGDPVAEQAELGVLRNKLTNGGAQVIIES